MFGIFTTRSALCAGAGLAAISAGAAMAAPKSRAAAYYPIHSFQGGADGAQPFGGLAASAGQIYGTTTTGGASGNGTVFTVNPFTGAEKVIYAFQGGSDGAQPYGALTNAGIALLGTTTYGGAHGGGTIFAINPWNGHETVLYSFQGGSDGAEPNGSLLAVGPLVFGTTTGGGATNNGTIFLLNLFTGSETVLYSFTGGNDGANPYGGLTVAGGVLYGTTFHGGGAAACTRGCGTVFMFNPWNNSEKIVHAFQGGADGVGPISTMIGGGNMLFGTTQYGGGTAQSGTVFAFNTWTGTETVLHGFGNTGDGAFPFGALTVSGQTLYGTTYAGGSANAGTIYAINPWTGGESVARSFQGGSDGANPYSGLLAFGQALFGTTVGGGGTACGGGCGTVFAITP